MSNITLYISKDNARKCIDELGGNELIHFKDLNNNIKTDQLLYVKEVKHIEKLMARLNFLGKYVEGEELLDYKNSDLEVVVDEVNKYYNRITQLSMIKKETCSKLIKLKEDLYMVEEMEIFVSDVSENKNVEFNFVTGIVDRNKKILIKKIMHEALRRNLVVKTKDIEKLKKTIFIILTHGKEALEKMTKIFVSLGGRVLNMNKYSNPQKSLLALTSVISQIESVEEHNDDALANEIRKMSNSYLTWKYYINKEHKIYTTLNKCNFDVNRDSLVGEAWIRNEDLYKLQSISETSEKQDWNFVFEKTNFEEMPPSSFKLTKYTQVFQDLVNVYGVPSYGEINPAIFMIFLFPMLFGVMFGDVFHGILLIFISVYFIRHTEKLSKQYKSLRMLIDGRYVMFLCGLSSIFFGFLYSDFTAFPINVFGARIANRTDVDDIYPFGIDPDWHHAENSMEFGNSVKMKLSIIIGFLHMGLGIVLAAFNCVYQKDMVELYSVVVPQALAFFSFVGYLVFLILYKWLNIDLTKSNPSIISTLVLMFTSPFEVPEVIFNGQLHVQLVIVCIILVSFPWMLLAKPIYLSRHRKIESEDAVDMWMNQGIHTIEYGIGLISNSSSYLRLWAVSLAHAQLTKVLVDCTIASDSIFVQILSAPVFAIGTFFLLIMLEGLGSVLHALRLNWIEFNSKFYRGSGYLFAPLSYKPVEEEE